MEITQSIDVSLFDLDKTSNYDMSIKIGALAIACKNSDESLADLKTVKGTLKSEGSLFFRSYTCSYAKAE
jgi:hypothetical protein